MIRDAFTGRRVPPGRVKRTFEVAFGNIGADLAVDTGLPAWLAARPTGTTYTITGSSNTNGMRLEVAPAGASYPVIRSAAGLRAASFKEMAWTVEGEQHLQTGYGTFLAFAPTTDIGGVKLMELANGVGPVNGPFLRAYTGAGATTDVPVKGLIWQRSGNPGRLRNLTLRLNVATRVVSVEADDQLVFEHTFPSSQMTLTNNLLAQYGSTSVNAADRLYAKQMRLEVWTN